MILSNERLHIEMYGYRTLLCDSVCHNVASMKTFFFLPFKKILFYFCVSRQGRLQGQKADARIWEMGGNEMDDVEDISYK